MLDIQALKFTRMFRKQVDLRLTRRDQLQFEADLTGGLNKARSKGEPTTPFEECFNAYRDALDEGRITVEGREE